MLYELATQDYERVRPIFQSMTYNLVPLAAIEGAAPGRIWVDDVTHPRTAFLWDKAHELFFAGEEHDQELNRALGGLLAEKVFPEAAGQESYVYVAHYWPSGWEGALKLILGERSSAEARRWLYRFERATLQWPEEIPTGLTVQRVDATFLARTALSNAASLIEWLDECWRSVDEYLHQGVAYSLLQGRRIISWCGVEYVNGHHCGLGVETDEPHRSKGYATMVAAACVRDCLARGLTVHWDCWANNLASARVAEKLGFERVAEYPVQFIKLGHAGT